MKRVSRFDRELQRADFRVAIFGSARVKRGDITYKLVYDLAKRIGHNDMDIVTGGGPGLMEASSRGHRTGNVHHRAHAVGLLIKIGLEEKNNKHLDVKQEFERFSERLDHFMALSNVVVVAPGGLGTLLEFFYTWQLIQVKQICNIPIILLGDSYRELIKWIRNGPLKHKYLNAEDLEPIFFAKDAKQAMAIINEAHDKYKQGGKNICLNMKKYKVK